MSHERLQAWSGSDWLAQLQNKHAGIHRVTCMSAGRVIYGRTDWLQYIKTTQTITQANILNHIQQQCVKKTNHPKGSRLHISSEQMLAIYPNTVYRAKTKYESNKGLF